MKVSTSKPGQSEQKVSLGFLAAIFGTRKKVEEAIKLAEETSQPVAVFQGGVEINLRGHGHSVRLCGNPRKVNETLAARAQGNLRALVLETSLGKMN